MLTRLRYMRTDFWTGILQNKILLTAVMAWLVAQVLKTIIYRLTSKEFDIKRLVGDGGMPSGHTATVTALAIRVAMERGSYSLEFAMAMIFAIIVMHDAMGVRRESGRHAQALNEIIDILDDRIDFDLRLKEFLGHTPFQVVAGAFLGAVVAVVSGFF